MNDFHLNIKAVAKSFRMHNFLFRDMSFDMTNSAVTALTGKNGSGKSTMLKICAGLLKPTEGIVELSLNGELLKKEQFNRHFGFVAPYLNLYDEFTPLELLKITADMRGLKNNDEINQNRLEQFGILKYKKRVISEFSSGMKQRMKFILALQHNPEILFLDEPSTNLDSEGIAVAEEMVKNHVASGGALLIATNDEREKSWCENEINIQRPIKVKKKIKI